MKLLKFCRSHFPRQGVIRWVAVAVLCMAVNFSALFGLVDGMGLPVPAATLLVLVGGTLLRFLLVHRWVFAHRGFAWDKLRAFLATYAVSAALWYGAANTLAWLGVHYLLAALGATACSAGFSLASTFLWIWRKPPASTPRS